MGCRQVLTPILSKEKREFKLKRVRRNTNIQGNKYEIENKFYLIFCYATYV